MMSPRASRNRPYNVFYWAPAYYFQTDHGLLYSARFQNITETIPGLEDQHDIAVQDFSFFPNGSPVADPRVAPTIISILEEFTDNKGDVIAYVCDAEDGRPEARQALFTQLGRRVADRWDHWPVKISSGGIALYGGAFTHKDFLYPEKLRDVKDRLPAIVMEKFGT